MYCAPAYTNNDPFPQEVYPDVSGNLGRVGGCNVVNMPGELRLEREYKFPVRKLPQSPARPGIHAAPVRTSHTRHRINNN